ncbi:MAG: exodeoxyribonuclease VII small subunit [Bacteroidales bacterium]
MAERNKKMSYEEAVTELEKLVAAVEDPNATLVNIEGELKRAVELIKYCKKELKGYGDNFAKILDDNKVN